MRFLPLLIPFILALAPTADAVPPGLPSSADRIEAPALESMLGFEAGERHPQHHELVRFYRALARDSERVRVETIGRTHGDREHILVYFASPDRIGRIDEIRSDRQRASRAGDGPPVVWLGYSVHGNEASGASAAAVTAWYLAYAEDEQVQRWLDELVIVMEPVINPDGVERFAHWANMHRGRNPSADPNDREHNEGWPSGRTGYYWFDLNRDWLPLTQPVSRQRIAHYRQWRPHVLTDAHEMGSDSTYFFQPGIPERNNPATPAQVFEFTRRIAEYHGELLDQAGEPYYSRESFDDYYLGKGSTYPDLTGGIGILFEQGSVRGHRVDTPYGERTFAEAIANQVRTSISTLEASVDLGDELLAYQADFFGEGREMGNGGWLLGDGGDPMRARRLLDILVGHGIEVRAVDAPVTIDGVEYEPGRAWAVPAEQDQFRFIRAIFSTPTELPMETFYDVSAWPLQHAFALPLDRARRLPSLGEALTSDTLPAIAPSAPAPEATAWVVPWNQHHAPAVLAELLADGYRVQVAQRELELDTADGSQAFDRGSLLIHAGIQPEQLPPVHQRLGELLQRHDVRAHSVFSGQARAGLDLGSPSAPVLEAPRPILVTGDPVSAYGAGYTWHWFDVLLDRPVTRIDADELPSSLTDYTHVILPPGRYASLGDEFAARLTEFVRRGGQVIALGNSAEWVESLDLGWSFVDGRSEDQDTAEDDDEPEFARYAEFDKDAARRIIGGSALAVELDTSHPLAYGYSADRLTTFRQGAHVLRASDNPYASPGRYAAEPLVAGYLSDEVAGEVKGTVAVAADRFGRGLVVRIADHPLFRGYWAGAERLFANALFFGQLVESTRLPD
ncbi:MAG: DUF4350 domain-containing protein [Candidatus Wenzhouxiangella sp. M2_3B_020]